MASSGTSQGTVVRWDEDAGGAVVEVAGLSGDCWAEASVVTGGPLRAGQVVTVDWTEDGAGGRPFRAVEVRVRDDLQATPGG
jgi:cold shock CspA family protein